MKREKRTPFGALLTAVGEDDALENAIDGRAESYVRSAVEVHADKLVRLTLRTNERFTCFGVREKGDEACVRPVVFTPNEKLSKVDRLALGFVAIKLQAQSKISKFGLIVHGPSFKV